MEFIHPTFTPGETIAAVATPPGEGGVAIIRISGNNALEIAAKIFTGPVLKYKSHTVHFGKILNLKREVVDEVLLLVMKDKRSYTGENTVEIHCHGGALITRRVLEQVLLAGARAALPGEFTFRAFINGKLDLAQAEAVQALIGAKNEHALKAAENHLQGNLSKKILHFQQALTETAAILEAWVDFPEEGLEFSTMEEMEEHLDKVIEEMETLLKTFHNGKIVGDGISMCLIGCPNVGKSSLMNALLTKDRAIVSPIPGTTRDLLEDHMCLNGLNFRLMDTAGIRKASDLIEQEGIRRSKEAMLGSDLILLVLDASKEIEDEENWLMDQVPKHKTIAIWNKMDLLCKELPPINFPYHVQISAKNQVGLDLLKEKIDEVIWEKGPPAKDEVLITSLRHKEALQNSISACRQVKLSLKSGVSPEFLSFDMRESLSELGKIIGTNITEDILSSIFSKFCIGK